MFLFFVKKLRLALFLFLEFNNNGSSTNIMITSIEYYYVHSSESFHTFHRMFYNMPQIIFDYSLDCLKTFPGMFGGITRNV